MFYSLKEVLRQKLDSLPSKDLKEFSSELGLISHLNKSDNIDNLLNSNVDDRLLESFIRKKYRMIISQRESFISIKDLIKELNEVKEFRWGTVQGELDKKIQTEYVRITYRYQDLLEKVSGSLYNEIKDYVICTWFNHWTTVLIEEYMLQHPKVLPTIRKNIKGLDMFFCNQPFDLKISPLPRGYDSEDAIKNPRALSVWLYENQGQQRFGSHNRFFIILFDKSNIEKSWELKRDFDFIFPFIDRFLETETVSKEDEISFTYNKKVYTAVSKILLIYK